MQAYVMSAQTRERAMRTRGCVTSSEGIDPGRTALLVVDMQNYFVAERAPGEVPAARAIVVTINTLAATLRSLGVQVVWIKTDATRALQDWSRHHRSVLHPQRARSRLAALDPQAPGFALYPSMQYKAVDLHITKTHYSAFIAGSSDLESRLRSRGIDTLLIAGTATNVCCESTARDAAMLDYRVIMVSDANASWTDQEHTASLNTFVAFFGDVMSADEVARQAAGSRFESDSSQGA
jgi:ureidoacrylate peracid hydrolase